MATGVLDVRGEGLESCDREEEDPDEVRIGRAAHAAQAALGRKVALEVERGQRRPQLWGPVTGPHGVPSPPRLLADPGRKRDCLVVRGQCVVRPNDGRNRLEGDLSE